MSIQELIKNASSSASDAVGRVTENFVTAYLAETNAVTPARVVMRCGPSETVVWVEPDNGAGQERTDEFELAARMIRDRREFILDRWHSEFDFLPSEAEVCYGFDEMTFRVLVRERGGDERPM